jgi:hypothetical protein
MNYCMKCESMYHKPGTCNCFAAAQPAITITPLPDYDPSTTVAPWVWPQQTTTVPWWEVRYEVKIT